MFLTAIQTAQESAEQSREWVDITLTAGVPLLVLVITLLGANWRAKQERDARDLADDKERAARARSELRQFKFRVREIQYEGVKEAVVRFLRKVDSALQGIYDHEEQYGAPPGKRGLSEDFRSLHSAAEQLELLVDPEMAKAAFEMAAFVHEAFDGDYSRRDRYETRRAQLTTYVRDYLAMRRLPAQRVITKPGGVTRPSAPTPGGTKKGPS